MAQTADGRVIRGGLFAFQALMETWRSEVRAIEGGFVEPSAWMVALEQQRVIRRIGSNGEPIEDEANYESM